MQEKKQHRPNSVRTEATRGALVNAAREIFAEKGYAETSTPEIVEAAGVTRGALYHHFEGKADLLRAVLLSEYQAVEAEITAFAIRQPKSHVDALLLGSRGYLQAMKHPGRVRLMLLDGPAVLDRRELDEMDRATSADALKHGLQAAMATGEIRQLPLAPLTSLLSAMFERAALDVANGEDEGEQLDVFEGILTSLAPR